MKLKIELCHETSFDANRLNYSFRSVKDISMEEFKEITKQFLDTCSNIKFKFMSAKRETDPYVKFYNGELAVIFEGPENLYTLWLKWRDNNIEKLI